MTTTGKTYPAQIETDEELDEVVNNLVHSMDFYLNPRNTGEQRYILEALQRKVNGDLFAILAADDPSINHQPKERQP